jgi:HK97 family phage prohead protease
MNMNQLAKKLVEEKRQKAIELSGKTIVKEYSCKAISINEEKKTAVFVMSTEFKDRYDDIIDQASWILTYFKENPYFAWQHKSNDFPLGRWLDVWLEADPDNVGKQRLVGEAYFATDIDEVAKRAWNHVKDGNIRMVSVGFIPHRVEYDEEKDAFILYDCELMECSLVGIGANRQALIKNNDDLNTIKETLIDTRDALDIKIKKNDNVKVTNNLKALELLSKAIRQIK